MPSFQAGCADQHQSSSFICCPCPLPELPEGTAQSHCFEGLPGNPGAFLLHCSTSPGDTRGEKSPLMTTCQTASFSTAVIPPLLSPIPTQWELVPAFLPLETDLVPLWDGVRAGKNPFFSPVGNWDCSKLMSLFLSS